MMPFRRASAPLPALLALVLLPASLAAQPLDAWTLPRGMLELGAEARYSHYDARLGWGGPALGAEFVPAYQRAVDRVLGEPVGLVREGLATVLGGLPGGDASLAEQLTGGRAALELAADVRVLPLSLRYGLTSRLTLFASVPLERRGTSVTGLYLAGGTVGLNPAADSNRAALARVDPAFADFGGGDLLPVAGSPAARALQERLHAASPGDTLRLPAFPLRLGELLGQGAPLTPEERAALELGPGRRRPYAFGDVQVGARFLLVPGPAGWPYPDDGARGARVVVGVRGRLPTGRSGVTFLTEIPAEGGHAGVGAEVLADLFPARRWSVHGGASLEQRFAADVPTLAFAEGRLLPADSAVRTVRRAPGLALEAALAPRWRLTDEIAFEGMYSLVARRRTVFSGGEDGLLASPLEWRTGGSAHAFGAGMRYSTLQSFSRGGAWPYEVSLGFTTALAGAGLAPDATTIRVSARILADPRGAAALLPGRGDPPAPPPPPPADTLPAPPAADTVPPLR